MISFFSYILFVAHLTCGFVVDTGWKLLLWKMSPVCLLSQESERHEILHKNIQRC